MSLVDPARLYSALLNTGLQSKDPPLYQVIYQMIGQMLKLTTVTTGILVSSSAGSGSGTGTDDEDFVPYYIAPAETFTVPEFKQALFAMNIVNDGILDVDGFLIEVDRSSSGSGTTINQQIIQQLMMDSGSSDGDSIIVPGPAGLNGINGLNGTSGIQGVPGQDGLDGLDEVFIIPNSPAVWTVISSTITGATNNWAPALNGNTLIEWSGSSDAPITGLVGGVVGQLVTIKNTGSKVATFAHQSASSNAGTKFTNYATSAPTPIAASGSITYQYDGTSWQIVSHEQGAWITWSPTITPNTGTFTGITATPALYRLSGKSMLCFVAVSGTAGGSPIYFNVPAPSTFTITDSVISPMYIGQNGSGVGEMGYCQSAVTKVICVRLGNAAWGNSTCTFYPMMTFDVD